jgi:hypothetical protein
MKVQHMNDVGTGALLAFCLLFISTAQARGGQQLKPPPSDSCLDCSRHGDARLGNERDRVINRQQEINREGSARVYGDNQRRSFEMLQEQRQDLVRKSYLKRLQRLTPQYQTDKGYRDGMDRGKEDARKRRTLGPNNSSHYRKGTEVYQEAFRRGYDEGYRQAPVK